MPLSHIHLISTVMLIREMLTETTDEDRALSSLAKTLFTVVTRFSSTNPKGGVVGRIGKIVDTPLVALSKIKIKVLPNTKFYRELGEDLPPEGKAPASGFWDPNTDTIVLNMYYENSLRWHKTIVHEMRHALDDVKSEYRASDKNRYSQHRDGYLHTPMEIHARYLAGVHMALQRLKRMYNAGDSKQQVLASLPGIINDVLDANQITRVLPGRYNDPAYKRLASRAYQLLSTEVNHIYRNSTSTG